ncbi:MAG TPA: hypothetical protein VNH22_17550 [Blastocatellia bacterium]|jgi:hypothetical protein|nr:hypothetical protein [Blastocatellia bacterium]
MNTIKKRITNEIEYLEALAAMYSSRGDHTAREAALGAVEALRRLLEVDNEKSGGSRGGLDFAA